MGYILKNTSGLINTRITDTGRLKISQGNFNISYFQIGDSEVSYNVLPKATYNQFNSFVLEPSFNAQNSAGVPQSNKENIKYPYYVDGTTGNTYGIPFMASIVEPVYNRAAQRGFFTSTTIDEVFYWSAKTNNTHVINSNYIVDMSTLIGTNTINVIYNSCNDNAIRAIQKGDIITIYFDGNGMSDCICITGTTTTTSTSTTTTTTNPCVTPIPTTTTTTTTCSFVNPCCPPPPIDCVINVSSCYSILTYRVVDVCNDLITLDRNTPNFSIFNSSCFARVLVYPPIITEIYDSITPSNHWSNDVINYESVCYTDEFDVKIWNMNIPWSETPAGIDPNVYKDYTKFGSINYLGSKEYFGYASSSGQTDTSLVYYYNSFDEKVTVTPEQQKVIAIVHYTNQTVDLFYGEKFALEPFDDSVEDTTGQARNFRIDLPWLMWHKNPNCCNGQTFYVDPPGFEDLNLFTVHHLESTKNSDMNTPGIRYYHLWDTNPNLDGYPSRVGKVFPDSKIIVFDDEEIIAAMSYKSNRNWTLPAPKISLVTPNICGDDNNSTEGILTGNTESLYVTYRLSNSLDFTNSLHCNYYSYIQGPNLTCTPLTSQNVALRFGSEFSCLSQPSTVTTTTTTLCPPTCNVISGFYADKFEIICQKVIGAGRPESDEWKIIDFTNQLSGLTVNGYITQQSITANTFVITQELYDTADIYDLSEYIDLTTVGFTGHQLNFGDEYYFYGNIETDIQATIYEMVYKINLSQAEFQTPSNPTWSSTNNRYITEVGLYDSDKNLMIISKMQSPILRQGIQQILIKLDI